MELRFWGRRRELGKISIYRLRSGLSEMNIILMGKIFRVFLNIFLNKNVKGENSIWIVDVLGRFRIYWFRKIKEKLMFGL